jgi:hypothetical protein
LVAHDPARFYPRSGVLPGVVEVRDQTGAWDAVGQTRTLVLTDGGTVKETLTAVTPPRFAYDLSTFTGFFGRLVASGRSEWRIAPDREGSSIEWTYTFTAKPGWGLLVATILRLAWAPYMRRVLPAIAESAVPPA